MLSENLIKYREKKGYTRYYVAKKANIQTDTLSRLERGIKDNPTLKTLIPLSKVLGVSIDKLVK